MKHIFLIVILLTSLTSSCSKTGIAYKADSITTNSKLILHENITIKTNLGRTFIQNGQFKPESDINIYYPHCSITVNTIQQQPQIISPTTFSIIKIVDDEEYAQRYMLYASTDIKIASDGPIITGLVSYFYLQSTSEPDVRTLECIQWDSLYENKYLSIAEIRQTLGDIFTLEL